MRREKEKERERTYKYLEIEKAAQRAYIIETKLY